MAALRVSICPIIPRPPGPPHLFLHGVTTAGEKIASVMAEPDPAAVIRCQSCRRSIERGENCFGFHGSVYCEDCGLPE